MKINIEDIVTITMEFKFKTKNCLLMTPATFEWKKINANIYIYRCIQTRENDGIGWEWETSMEKHFKVKEHHPRKEPNGKGK